MALTTIIKNNFTEDDNTKVCFMVEPGGPEKCIDFGKCTGDPGQPSSPELIGDQALKIWSFGDFEKCSILFNMSDSDLFNLDLQFTEESIEGEEAIRKAWLLKNTGTNTNAQVTVGQDGQ